MKISINAPSYKRSWGVDTLKYIPWCKIWVCESEAKKYRKMNPGAEIISVKKGIQGNTGRIRNHILDMENEAGMDAVCMVDDDLRYLGYFENKKPIRLKTDGIIYFLSRYTLMAKEIGARIWGVNINRDKQSYREYTPFSLTSTILGPFTVHIQSPIRYDESLPLKEDYDMTLQHLNRYRKVLRLNRFFYEVKQGGSGSGQTGGCAAYRNIKKEMDQLLALQKKWGSKIVRRDEGKSRSHNTTKKRSYDVNPIIKVPIKGV